MIQSPYFNINYGWPYGSDGWNTGMDENLVRLSFLARNAVTEFTNSLQASPAPGYSCILNSDSLAYFWLGESYVFVELEEGYEFTTLSDGKRWRKQGGAYVEIPTTGSLDTRTASLEVRMGDVENDLSQVIVDSGNTAQNVNDILDDASSLPVTSDSITQSLTEWMDFVRSRANHTGQQPVSTIEDFDLNVVDAVDSSLFSRTMDHEVDAGVLSIENKNDKAATIEIDSGVVTLPQSGSAVVVLTENVTSITLPSAAFDAISKITVLFIQDDTTPYTVTGWDGSIRWESGSAPVISDELESRTVVELINVNSSGWIGRCLSEELGAKLDASVIEESIPVPTVADTGVPNNSFFVDSADDVLKFKDSAGAIFTVSLTP